jgi:hypothetical protein
LPLLELSAGTVGQPLQLAGHCLLHVVSKVLGFHDMLKHMVLPLVELRHPQVHENGGVRLPGRKFSEQMGGRGHLNDGSKTHSSSPGI